MVELEINKLLSKKAMEPSKSEKNELIWRIFVRRNKEGTCRLILILTSLNQNVGYHHFKVDALHSFQGGCIAKNCWMASVDLKNHTIILVPLLESIRNILKCSWNNPLYRCACFPNQLACCQRNFNRLTTKGYITAAYVDDTYLEEESKQECRQNAHDTVTLLQSLGLVADPDKSVF